jgi:hypothetical protein
VVEGVRGAIIRTIIRKNDRLVDGGNFLFLLGFTPTVQRWSLNKKAHQQELVTLVLMRQFRNSTFYLAMIAFARTLAVDEYLYGT